MRKRVMTIMSVLLASLSSSFGATSNDFKINHMANESNSVVLEATNKYLLLPIQENAPEAKVGIIKNNVHTGVYSNVRLARERVDYYVPYDISEYRGEYITVDIQGMPQNSICWSNIKYSDTFDTTNTEKFRPTRTVSIICISSTTLTDQCGETCIGDILLLLTW